MQKIKWIAASTYLLIAGSSSVFAGLDRSLELQGGYTFGDPTLSTTVGLKGACQLTETIFTAMSYSYISGAGDRYPSQPWNSAHLLTADFGNRFKLESGIEVKPYFGLGAFSAVRTRDSFPNYYYNFLFTVGFESTISISSSMYLGLDTKLTGGPIGFLGVVSGVIGHRF